MSTLPISVLPNSQMASSNAFRTCFILKFSWKKTMIHLLIGLSRRINYMINKSKIDNMLLKLYSMYFKLILF